jgi:hypothetical protein
LCTCLLLCRDSDGTNSETDRDTLGPLPAPQSIGWAAGQQSTLPPSYFPHQPSSALGVNSFGGGGPPPTPLGPIYNPAPPPSTYMTFNYGGADSQPPPAGGFGGYGGTAAAIGHHSPSSGSSGSGNRGGGLKAIAKLHLSFQLLSIELPVTYLVFAFVNNRVTGTVLG